MDNEKNFGYTLLLGICMLICLILVGKMLLHRPTSVQDPSGDSVSDSHSVKENNSVRIKQEDIAQLIQEKLPENFPARDISVSIEKDGTIGAQCSLSKDSLKSLASGNGAMRSALIFMPSEFDVQVVFHGESDDNGTLVLTPQKVTADNVDIPISMFPDTLSGKLNELVNTVLHEYDTEYHTIQFDDGLILLED